MQNNIRIESGIEFTWMPDMNCWRSSAGNSALVFPPPQKKKKGRKVWCVIYPGNLNGTEITGRGAMKKAFALAKQSATR